MPPTEASRFPPAGSIALPAGGLEWRSGRAQVDIAIAVGVAAATAQQRLAIRNESRDGGGGAILRERFAQIGALRVLGIFRIAPIHRALLIARRRAGFLRDIAGDTDHLPERGFVAVLDARFLEKWAIHSLRFSPPSAMVRPRLGDSNARSSLNRRMSRSSSASMRRCLRARDMNSCAMPPSMMTTQRTTTPPRTMLVMLSQVVSGSLQFKRDTICLRQGEGT